MTCVQILFAQSTYCLLYDSPPSLSLHSLSCATVPSGPPTNVRAEPGGGGSVRVTWTQPSGKVSGYVIVYGPTNAPPTETPSPVNVEDPAAIDYTIEDIAPEIEFTIEMWAYLDLPSSSSNPTTIYLDGENPHTHNPTTVHNVLDSMHMLCVGDWVLSDVKQRGF